MSGPITVVDPQGGAIPNGGETRPRLLPQTIPTILPLEADFDAATSNLAFAEQHAAAADQFVAKLGDLMASLAPPTIQPNFPVVAQAPSIAIPPAPNVTPITYTPPPIPSEFTGQLGDMPSFPDFTSTPPQLLFPNAPVPQLGDVPPVPQVDYNFAYPTIDVDLPSAPELLSLNIPKFDGVNFPQFTAQSPVLNLIAPQVYAYVASAPYSSNLLTALRSFLLARISGDPSIALSPAVEEGIWAREQEREYRQQRQALDDLDRMEVMGYALPPGVWIDSRIKLQTDTMYTLAGSSRDIATQQAKLAQDNCLKALELSNAIESKLIDYSNLREQRNFDATRYATESGIQIYNALVQTYAQKLETYKAAISAYTAQLDGAKITVQVYQAQLDAEKTKVDMDTALVQQYKVRVDAALASIQVFQGEIDLIKTQAQVEQLKVQTFGELVKSYVAQANVYTAEVEGYKAAVSAEQTKQATYATSAQAYATLVEATGKEIDANIASFRALIEAKTEEYNAYKAQVEGAAEAVRAEAAANTAVADIYRAVVSGTSSYNDAMVKEWEAQITLAEKISELGVQAAQANGTLYTQVASIASEAAKAAAQIEAQMAASAIGTTTYATHRARQDSVSFSNGINYSTNFSTSYQASYSSSAYNSYEQLRQIAISSSTSTSTATVHNIQSVE